MNNITKMPDEELYRKVAEVVADMNRGIKTAAAAVVELVVRHGFNKVADDFKEFGVPVDILRRFLYVGESRILPELAFDSQFGRIARKLTLAEQRKLAVNEPIEVVTDKGEILKVKPSDMTSFQKRQVFSKDGIRSDSAQRAWLESEKSKSPRGEVVEIKVHFSKSKGLTVNGTTISPDEIIRYARKLLS